ncbi:MAG TPA: hemerythrin domain-containing protein [Candidatus Limnocylindria bacterium]|nr:hemerythrin domain-containing protein [Candidatus Limnocylindria bacterium]
MTPASITAHTERDAAGAGHTLAGEHARLMRDVERRAAPVLTLLDAHAWPHAELGTLTKLLRADVLRQVSDEEVHLYPHDSSVPPFVELSADHARLYGLTARLEQAHISPCQPAQLRALVQELLSTLRRHLEGEQHVLAALADAADEVPSATDLAAADRAWLPDDTPVRLELDGLPDDEAVELAIARLLRLRPGQTAELHAHDDWQLRAVCRWIHDFDAERFGLDHSAAGSDHLLGITCRTANTSAGIGYPG